MDQKSLEYFEIWTQVMGMCCKIERVLKSFPEEIEPDLLTRLKQDVVALPEAVERGLEERSFRSELVQFNLAQLKLKRLQQNLLTSKYLEYLEEDTFDQLIYEITLLIRKIHKRRLMSDFLFHSVNPEYVYSYLNCPSLN